MALSAEEVSWVAHLARLDLSEAELSSLTRDLGSILGFVDQLKSVDTTGVEPLVHAVELHNVFRDDTPAPSLTVEAALANAPERRRDATGKEFYAVPAVFE